MFEYFFSYVLSFQNIIDFWATIPWYIWLCVDNDAAVKLKALEVTGNLLRTLRVLRMFRTRALSSPYVKLLVSAVVRKKFVFYIFLERV